MELGRLLREEGITPNVISKNKSLLIQAMKKTLEDLSISPDAASFKTALEYQSFPSSARQSLRNCSEATGSLSLLSSAPSLGATFPNDLLARSHQVSSCLERRDNIKGGLKSLMDGMTRVSQSKAMSEQPGDEIDLEE